MTIERFTTKEFEQALPKGFASHGLIGGERVYSVSPSDCTRIMIRSSIGANGVAKESGDDSIRMWLEVLKADGSFQPLGDDLSVYTTRVSGWERRTLDKIGELAKVGMRILQPIPVCQDCGKFKKIYVTKKPGNNLGRSFFKCPIHNGFTWADEGAKRPSTPAAPAKDVFAQSEKKTAKDLFADEFVLIEEFASGEGEEAEEETAPQPRREPNEEQAKIINAPIDKNIRVLAGPGSGKTFTSENRVVHLIREHSARAGEILYVTFTKTMADEGAERIGKRLSQDLSLSELEIAEYKKWFCTIHAACYRFLKAEGDKRGVAAHWQMNKAIDPLIEKLWDRAEKDGYKRPGREEVMKAIVNAKYHGQRPGYDKSFFVQYFGDYHGPKLSIARERFDAEMRHSNLLTFPDMLYDMEQKLHDPKFAHKLQNQFRFVIVDEGQDTNGQAMRILTRIAEGNHFMVVGDADQLLMRFTGATPEENLYEGFEGRYPDGLLFMLETNYRSTNALVELANKVIRFNYEEDGGPYQATYRKNLKAGPAAQAGLTISFDEYDECPDEAAALVNNIREQLANGRKPGDIFVGARTRAQLGYLEGPLTAAGIPFINIKGGSFWLQKHVADVVSYVRLAHDTGNKEAFKRVFNIASKNFTAPWGEQKGKYVNHRFLGAEFLKACGDSLKGADRAVAQRRAWKPGVDDLAELITWIGQELEESVEKAIRTVMSECYDAYLAFEDGNADLDEADGGKLNDIQTVIDLASRFKTATEFFAHVDSAIEAAQKAKDKDWGAYVVLSTIHGLKGLERPIVYGVGISEGEIPPKDGDPGEGIPSGLLPHTFSMVMPPQKGAFDFNGMGRVEDERCAFFVLCTRAKIECRLSGVRRYRRAFMWPSRFLFEAGILPDNGEEAHLKGMLWQQGNHSSSTVVVIDDVEQL